MDDLINEFLTETNESLDELDLDLVNLEQNPNDKDLLSKIFRLMHTIKGTCGFWVCRGWRKLHTTRKMFWGVFAMAIWKLRPITSR